MQDIPVVDLSSITSTSIPKNGGEWNQTEDWDRIAKLIEDALSGVGFVYLINHGIPKEKIEEAFKDSKNFFDLPRDVKLKYRKDATKSFHGYSEPGQELLNDASTFELRESFDIPAVKEDRYPEEVPSFKTSLLLLKDACHPLIDILNKILAKSLKLEDENYFCHSSKWMQDDGVKSLSAFRSLFYPPIQESSSILPGTVRCAEHTDYGTITLLFQDSIGGLEVKTAENEWTAATPIPGSILVNTGDLLEFWSGGYFPATTHRVLVPEEELRKKVARQSMVYFVHPDNDVIVSPLSTQCGKYSQYEETTAEKHAMLKLTTSYQY